VVSIQATAIDNYHFVNWTGTAVSAGKVANPNSAGTTVTVDGDYTLQANFAPDEQQHMLRVSSTWGGQVTNPGEGEFEYDDETVVPVQATSAENYHAVRWRGTAVSHGKVANPNAASTTVTVDADYTLRAVFAPGQLKKLNVSSTSGGSVTDPGEGEFEYDDGTVVSIQATSEENYQFVSWTGTAVVAGKVANPNAASTAVTVDTDYTIQANFNSGEQQHTLSISSTNGGSVTDPGEGDFEYDDEDVVSIQATAVDDYGFVNWTGTAVDAGKVADPDAAGTTVTMDADYTLQANFAGDQHDLTISSTSGGTVTTPGEGTYAYDHGEVVPLQATVADNYYFVNWTGTAVDAGKVANPNAAGTTVTADADYTLQANFGQQDGSAPTLSNLSPAADDIQVPLNSLITLHVTDAGIGVDAGSVTITLDGATIYAGDTSEYSSATGNCSRIGTPADYTYVYQSNENFDFDETKTVAVNASDLGEVVMTEQSYSFMTEMRSFGANKQVDSTVEGLDKSAPSTVVDGVGNIWSVWHAGPVGSRDIYIGKLAAGADTFGASAQLTSNIGDQSNPAIAVGTDDRLYVVWQDNRQADDNNQGDWDIYVSTSSDGVTWSVETRVNDPNEGNQLNPAIAVDGGFPNSAHVVWQDDRGGNYDICLATSSNRFTSKTVAQPITSDSSDQSEPVIAVDSSARVYVLWTDVRNPSNGHDIYGAASNVGPWANVPVVTKDAEQSSPAIAVESTGSILHILWVDQTSGDSGIYYASSDGLPGSPLTGSNLIDGYAVGSGQFSPSVAVTGSVGNGLKVFTCWHDERDVLSSGDTDIWFVQANSGSGTNIFIDDGGTNSDQTEPAIGIDQYGYPYVVWTDGRGTNTEIYFAASTHMSSTPLASGQVGDDSWDVTIGTDPASIDDVDDVSVAVPAGACPYDVTITITELDNLPELPPGGIGISYDLAPSGLEFSSPVTITIPHAASDCPGLPIYRAYWYDPLIGGWGPVGGIPATHIEISPTLHAVTFETTHFTHYGVGATASGGGGGGGGGGGCSLSRSHDGSIVEYFLPYGALILIMFIIKWRDRRYRGSS
jgi:hypothetical protein